MWVGLPPPAAATDNTEKIEPNKPIITQQPTESNPMSSIFSHFKTDTLLEEEGVDIDYVDFKLRLRRAGGANKKYALAFSDAAKKHKNKGYIASDTQYEVMLEAFVKGCYVEHSWYTKVGDEYQRGIHNEKEEVVPGTLTNVYAILKQLPDLFEALLKQAQDIDVYKSQQTAKAAEALKE